jgi:hypothetical protein
LVVGIDDPRCANAKMADGLHDRRSAGPVHGVGSRAACSEVARSSLPIGPSVASTSHVRPSSEQIAPACHRAPRDGRTEASPRFANTRSYLAGGWPVLVWRSDGRWPSREDIDHKTMVKQVAPMHHRGFACVQSTPTAAGTRSIKDWRSARTIACREARGLQA